MCKIIASFVYLTSYLRGGEARKIRLGTEKNQNHSNIFEQKSVYFRKLLVVINTQALI